MYGRYHAMLWQHKIMISDITVDSQHTNFSILPARRAGTYANGGYTKARIVSYGQFRKQNRSNVAMPIHHPHSALKVLS